MEKKNIKSSFIVRGEISKKQLMEIINTDADEKFLIQIRITD